MLYCLLMKKMCLYDILTSAVANSYKLVAHIRKAESNPMDTTFTYPLRCWFLGSHGCSGWRCFLLAHKFRMGDGASFSVLILVSWCNSCSLSWISSWPWIWKVRSGKSFVRCRWAQPWDLIARPTSFRFYAFPSSTFVVGCRSDYIGNNSKLGKNLEGYKVHGRLKLDKDKVVFYKPILEC